MLINREFDLRHLPRVGLPTEIQPRQSPRFAEPGEPCGRSYLRAAPLPRQCFSRQAAAYGRRPRLAPDYSSDGLRAVPPGPGRLCLPGPSGMGVLLVSSTARGRSGSFRYCPAALDTRALRTCAGNASFRRERSALRPAVRRYHDRLPLGVHRRCLTWRSSSGPTTPG